MSYYNPAVLPSLRARLLTLTAADARSTKTPKETGVDAAIIRCGYSSSPATSGMNYKEGIDKAWDIRQKDWELYKLPVIGWYEHDPAWYRWNNVDENMVNARDVSSDPVMMNILRCLFKDPSASWDIMRTSKPGAWRNIQGFMLSQYNNVYQSQDVGDFWFTLSMTNVINRLKSLMDSGVVPAIPIIFQTKPALMAQYQVDLATWLSYKPASANDSPARNSWLYLAYGSPAVWTLFAGHNEFPTIQDCWQYTWVNLPTTYSWSYVPDGYEKRILFHEVSGQRLFTPAYTDSAGLARPLTMSLFNDTPAVLQNTFPVVAAPVSGSTPIPPIDLTALTARVAALELNMSDTLKVISALQGVVSVNTANIADAAALIATLKTMVNALDAGGKANSDSITAIKAAINNFKVT